MRLVVRLPNWLGDLLMARPAVIALRAAHPNAILEAIAPPGLRALAGWDRVFETIHAWPDSNSARGALARSVRLTRPDAVLVLPPSFSSAWWALGTGAPVRVGFNSEARASLLTRALARPARGECHLSEEYLMLSGVLGARATPVGPLAVPESAHASARQLRETLAVHGPHVVLGPGAIYGPAKRWNEAGFIAVGRALAKRGDAVLVCGIQAEREACARVALGIGPGAIVVAGETDLATQAALCSSARLSLCNDSGLAHLSAATGAPTVVVFGSTSSAWSAPLGSRVRVIQHAPPCSPCFQRTCRIGYRCLAAVSPREVLDACVAVAA